MKVQVFAAAKLNVSNCFQHSPAKWDLTALWVLIGSPERSKTYLTPFFASKEPWSLRT